jgi:hypothetical protein
MHKGPDSIRLITKDLYHNLERAGVNLDDEVLRFQLFRYLSAGEAYCRIFNYDLSKSSVGCTRLPVHLQGMDWVGAASAKENSKLEAYFKRPLQLQELLYLDYYSKFSVDQATASERAAVAEAGGGLYKPKRGNAFYLDSCVTPNHVRERNPGCLHVARMFPVSVTQGELYYLRLLLTCVAATSYESLRTAGGIVFPTFRQAAEAHGLLTVEHEFSHALGAVTKALRSGTATVSDVRHTFVMIAVAGGEAVPVQGLYREFKYAMGECRAG